MVSTTSPLDCELFELGVMPFIAVILAPRILPDQEQRHNTHLSTWIELLWDWCGNSYNVKYWPGSVWFSRKEVPLYTKERAWQLKTFGAMDAWEVHRYRANKAQCPTPSMLPKVFYWPSINPFGEHFSVWEEIQPSQKEELTRQD